MNLRKHTPIHEKRREESRRQDHFVKAKNTEKTFFEKKGKA